MDDCLVVETNITDNSIRLEKILGYEFQDKAILNLSMVHSSMVKKRLDSNERLEFVGDRVLGLIIAEILYQTFPNEVEGQLGYRFASLVRSDCLASIAEKLELGDFIYLSPGALDASKQARKRILSNACEAIIAAIFLDGGYSEAFCFVEKHWRPLIIESTKPVKDSKTRLQEWAQSKKYPVPTYSCLDQSGPDHSPIFIVEVSIPAETKISARAEGPSKRIAETRAAKKCLHKIEIQGQD